jgi:hypothetical protein
MNFKNFNISIKNGFETSLFLRRKHDYEMSEKYKKSKFCIKSFGSCGFCDQSGHDQRVW